MKSVELQSKRGQISEPFATLVPEKGILQTEIEGVRIYRITESSPRQPQSYGPRIVFLFQGQKRIFLGDKTFVQDASNYLVLAVPLPVECEMTATLKEPLLGVSVTVTPEAIVEILHQSNDKQGNETIVPEGPYTAEQTETIIDTVYRLLQSLRNNRDARLLGPMIVRELIYRVAFGDGGESLRAIAYRKRHFFMIARALDTIHEAFYENLDIQNLAAEAGMSISMFHSCFKTVTNTSPIQYIKNIRLHKARALMLHDGLNALAAATRVGYESPSQFSREYKRFFGVTPGQDTAKIREEGRVSI
ncbi:AraC family transcriptional regulator [Leptospira stimsonii]|uniref:AraC family transcriptional regulator n=1 Tax=Leptospira stimsonii TaxID=2202203 RepID=A0A396Z6L0_9LEPT|nr:AraC family transcriptional regulator [Leptospira stimsonii]RHX89334.1 AraC family transcriptional regulator [Leptospira stimsonii]